MLDLAASRINTIVSFNEEDYVAPFDLYRASARCNDTYPALLSCGFKTNCHPKMKYVVFQFYTMERNPI